MVPLPSSSNRSKVAFSSSSSWGVSRSLADITEDLVDPLDTVLGGINSTAVSHTQFIFITMYYLPGIQQQHPLHCFSTSTLGMRISYIKASVPRISSPNYRAVLINRMQPEREEDAEEYQREEGVRLGSFDEQGNFTLDPDWHKYFTNIRHLLFNSGATLTNFNPELVNSPLHYELSYYSAYLVSFLDTEVFTGKCDLQRFSAFSAQLGMQYPQGFAYFSHIMQAESAETVQPKKKKGPVPVKREKKVVEVVQKQFDDSVRKEDPTIDLEALWACDKYKNIEDFKRENCNLVFIGHVDHGKSTLCGKILTELDQVDEQESKRLDQEVKNRKRQGWKFAFVMDVDEHEMAKGKTVECGKAGFCLEKRRFTLIDSPGHKNYVPNMMAGACQADLAGLIVSASEGEFEAGFKRGGQTQEHAFLARSLGVHQLVVVITKMETVGWSEKRFTQITSELVPFLQQSVGFKGFQVVPLDSLAGQNISRRIDKSVCEWYEGPCLFEVLDSVVIPPRKPLGHLRIPVIDCYKEQGQLYIYGKIEEGTVLEEQYLTLMPTKNYLQVKEINDVREEKMPFASAGENVRLRIRTDGKAEEEDIKRGMIICNNQNICQSCREFQAKITILELPEENKILSEGFQCVLHMHSMMEDVTVAKIRAMVDPKTGKAVETKFLRSGATGVIDIRAVNPDAVFNLEKYEFMECLGRFTLRSGSCTIGFGEVRKIKIQTLLTKEQKEQLKGKAEPAEPKS